MPQSKQAKVPCAVSVEGAKMQSSLHQRATEMKPEEMEEPPKRMQSVNTISEFHIHGLVSSLKLICVGAEEKDQWLRKESEVKSPCGHSQGLITYVTPVPGAPMPSSGPQWPCMQVMHRHT